MNNLKKNLLKAVFASTLLFTLFATNGFLFHHDLTEVKADDSSGYVEYDPRQIGSQYFTNWKNEYPATNEEQWHGFSDENNQCWVRFVVDVASEGDYKIFLSLNVTNLLNSQGNARFYVNNLTPIAVTPDSNVSGADNSVTGHFNQGKNVFLIEMIWNSAWFNKIFLPNSFTPVSTNVPQTYYAMNANNRGLKLDYGSNSNNLFDPDYILDAGFIYPEGASQQITYSYFVPNTQMIFTVSETSGAEFFAYLTNTSSVEKTILYQIDNNSQESYGVPANTSNTPYSLGELSAGNHTIKFWQASDSVQRLKVHKITAVLGVTLESIDSVSGTLYGIKNGNWNFSELVVTGTDSDNNTVDISSSCTFVVNSPSLNTAGSGNDASITVSAGGLSQTFSNISYVIYNMQSLTPTQIRNQTKVLGRDLGNANYITLDYSLSGLEFNFTGRGDVFADLEVISNTNNTRFVVEVDYGEATYVSVGSNGNNQIALARNLSNGFHHIVFYKTSEAYGNQINLTGLTYIDGGVISKPVDHKLKLEVIGDSISCGVGLASDEDAYQSFAMLLAKEWNADISNVSVNGKGLVNSWDIANGWALGGPQMPEIWSKTLYYRDQSISYNYSYDADIVVINLGNNDCQSGTGTTVAQFESAMNAFNQTLKAAYGNETIIIWTFGAYTQRGWVSSLSPYIESLQDSTIKFVGLPKLNSGANNHPNASEHKTITKILKGYEDYRFLEAENYATDSTTVKTNQSNQNWSNDGFIGSMTGDNKFFEYNYNIVNSGQYLIRVGITGSNYNIKYNLDNDVVTGSQIKSTNSWYPSYGTFAEYEEINLQMTSGNHSFGLWNTTNTAYSGWINFDYVEIFPMIDLDSKEANYINAFLNETHFECSNSLDGNGFNQIVWKNLELRYQSLSSSQKSALLDNSAFVDRYVAVLTSHPTFSNFLEGANLDISNILNQLTVFESLSLSSESVVVIIVALSACITLFVFSIHKKRREF